MNKRKKGEYWETIASKYLEQKGFQIHYQNWTCHWGEIDLVATTDNFLVFVEVKYRSNLEFGYPWEAVRNRKRIKQFQAIKHFLHQHNAFDTPWRFDVISVLKVQQKYQFQHFEFVPLLGEH